MADRYWIGGLRHASKLSCTQSRSTIPPGAVPDRRTLLQLGDADPRGLIGDSHTQARLWFRDGELWHVRSETVDPRQTGGARLLRHEFSELPQRASRLRGPRRARLRGGVPFAERHATARRREEPWEMASRHLHAQPRLAEHDLVA